MDDLTNMESQKSAERQQAQIALAPIHSEAELKEFLANRKQSPLDALSPRAQKRFIESLTFNRAGITSFSYEDIRNLSPRQAYAILSLFGAQETVSYIRFEAGDAIERAAPGLLRPVVPFDDHPGYRCTPPYTCTQTLNAICLSTCSIP
jgi:hypothetical protein